MSRVETVRLHSQEYRALIPIAKPRDGKPHDLVVAELTEAQKQFQRDGWRVVAITAHDAIIERDVSTTAKKKSQRTLAAAS